MLRIESLDDPRVAAYRNLRDRTLRGESVFVAEGATVTRRLLASSYAPESVFVSHEFLEEFEPLVPPGVPLYVAAEPLLLEIVGFNFHRGVLAAGRRRPAMSLAEIMAGKESGPVGIVICPEITKPENLGLVFRTAAAFGVDAILLGERSCDPFSRRALRVSMGATLAVPFGRLVELAADLALLRERWNVGLVAAVLDPRAEPLDGFRWPARAGLVIGNEFEGLQAACLALCGRRVTIPMRAVVDSLNLGVAAGIFVYDMMRGRR